MKKSYYNFLFPQKDESAILYNSRTGAMAELDVESKKQLIELTEQELADRNPDFADALLENEFAVEDAVLERDMIRFDSLKARYGNRDMGLTIVPTSDCNFRCSYCYEKEILRPVTMDRETQDALIKYVEEHVMAEGTLLVCWYGGEPLLALDIIEELTGKMRQICEKKGVTYNADMITNGYLLTEENALRLTECGVSKIQITLDGDRNNHDKRRFLRGGKGTFDVIWKNIVNLKQFGEQLTVSVRVNVDGNNPSALREISQKVQQEGLETMVRVYPGRVMDSERCYHEEVCFKSDEFALLEQEFYCEESGYLPSVYPQPQKNVCMADLVNSFLIDADGYMYKCYKDIGKRERAIRNVKSNQMLNESLLHRYVLYEPAEDEVCGECKFLPLCQGGCPYERINGKNQCTYLKKTIGKYMDYLPEAMRQNG